MANTFKAVTKTAVSTTATTIYTCPSATATTIIGLNIANINTGTDVTIDVLFNNNDGDDVYLVKGAPVPMGSSLVAVGGDQKVVLNASDYLQVVCSDSDSVDVLLSLLEIT